MRVIIGTRRLETTKAGTRDWALQRGLGVDAEGMVYLSSDGTWYMLTPSTVVNLRQWRLTTPEEVLEKYGGYLTPLARQEIAELAEEGWE